MPAEFYTYQNLNAHDTYIQEPMCINITSYIMKLLYYNYDTNIAPYVTKGPLQHVMLS